MNDSEKLHEIYGNLVDISARLSILQCLDAEMFNFSDCSNNGSHKILIFGVSLIATDLRNKIDDIFKIIDI